VVSSEYATIAAEQTALENLAREVADRMATRIALTLRERDRAADAPL
jgi:LPS-assembly lipoprotein